MTASTEKIRSLTVDGTRYRWRVTHKHQVEPSTRSGRTCINELMAFREGTSGSALRISFTDGPQGGTEYVQRHGVIRLTADSITVNLHRPKTAASLIRHARIRGWHAEPLTIEDGFAFIAGMPATARAELAEPL